MEGLESIDASQIRLGCPSYNFVLVTTPLQLEISSKVSLFVKFPMNLIFQFCKIL